MARTATIQARIDPKVKARAKKVLDELNISMSEAVSLYLTQVALRKEIPFKVKIPNGVTAQTLRKAEKGEDVHEVLDAEELFQELDT